MGRNNKEKPTKITYTLEKYYDTFNYTDRYHLLWTFMLSFKSQEIKSGNALRFQSFKINYFINQEK